jgi:uncharacterized protein
MATSFALATLTMGVVGGPHCIVMCGAACAYMQQQTQQRYFFFYVGRLIGYSLLGALAASSVKGLAWFSSQASSLHPLWTFFHVMVFAWGLILLIFAKQPIFADDLGKKLWQKMQSLNSKHYGTFVTGLVWAFIPCGLLYSALLVASLQASPAHGALSMAAFALGSSLSLFFGARFWVKLKTGIGWLNENLSMRLAGLFLVIVSIIAIYMDLMHQTNIWCKV